MNIYAMGDYYVWHCDWCDSTNHTLWNRLDTGGLSCAACHQHFTDGALKNPYNAPKHSLSGSVGISC